MTNGNVSLNKRQGLLAASVVIGLAMIVCCLIAAGTAVKVRGMGNTIRVTGAAFQPIQSDLALWDGQFSVQSMVLEDAYETLKSHRAKVAEFMSKSGFAESEYEFSVVRLHKRMTHDRRVGGYTVSQTVGIKLEDVDRITALAKEASTLIEQGVAMESHSPQYLFTGLDTLKIEMIRRATENAKLRAAQLAETTGRRVGAPISAGVGVFQIRPLHSQQVSGRGISDVSSIDKEIVSTVHVNFLIE
ncbi:MAG: SIMPL domain-containing protein [candidate division Zixibacteria bacterium]|nr:SIMPL domain-containing protein [candidate division Zixibacteria bacterium]